MNRYMNIGFSCVTAALVATAAAGLSAQTQSAARANQATMAATAPVSLGAVRIPRAVRADGKPLAAGTYQVRVTTQVAEPAAPGQTPQYERWAEFLQGGQVRGREVVSVVPNSDISQVAEGKPPASGGYKVELLKGNDYLRLWINRGGNHYLSHFTVPTT
jgi:hypothetical protein